MATTGGHYFDADDTESTALEAGKDPALAPQPRHGYRRPLRARRHKKGRHRRNAAEPEDDLGDGDNYDAGPADMPVVSIQNPPVVRKPPVHKDMTNSYILMGLLLGGAVIVARA